MSISSFIGKRLARFLSKPATTHVHVTTCDVDMLAATLRKGDVLLVEGNSRFSVAVKYLTQSSWSHATLYVGDALGPAPEGQEPRVLVEADLNEGVRAMPLSFYAPMHTRICRPVGLRNEEIEQLVDFVITRLGYRYDLKNVIDLARYFFPQPLVPNMWRRRMLALGSGDPTRAICSTLIAQAFQALPYPILPEIYRQEPDDPAQARNYREIMHIRHHSLFAPRDFDVSPYFRIVKPTLEHFDPHRLHWASAVRLPDSGLTEKALAEGRG